MFEITDHEKYLLVKPDGKATMDKFIKTIQAMCSNPVYLQRNDIWEFGDAQIDLTFPQLEAITKFIDTNYPANATRTKTALVISPGFNAAITELWVSTTGDLPYEARIFSHMDEAVGWISE